MEENYQNNVENNVEDVYEEINLSETKNVKKDIVINKRYVKFYLKCLSFSFLTVIVFALFSIETENSTDVLDYNLSNWYESSYYRYYKIKTIFTEDFVYVTDVRRIDYPDNSDFKYSDTFINVIFFFLLYLFIGIPLYWYFIISLPYILLLWFFNKYRVKFI